MTPEGVHIYIISMYIYIYISQNKNMTCMSMYGLDASRDELNPKIIGKNNVSPGLENTPSPYNII
jgi:hypothetical protein